MIISSEFGRTRPFTAKEYELMLKQKRSFFMWKTIIATLALSILRNAVKFVWELLWKIVNEAMLEAETKWHESGSGIVKKEWVITTAMSYISKHTKLNFVSDWVLRFFLSNVIDAVIGELNTAFTDHKWADHVSDLRTYIEKYLPTF